MIELGQLHLINPELAVLDAEDLASEYLCCDGFCFGHDPENDADPEFDTYPFSGLVHDPYPADMDGYAPDDQH